jgi:predicted RNase H-like HicB family nuclease
LQKCESDGLLAAMPTTSPSEQFSPALGAARAQGWIVERAFARIGATVSQPRCVKISLMSEFTVDVEREDDGRWIGEVTDLPGVLTYGTTREEAVAKAKALAFRVLADRLDHGEDIPELHGVFAVNE